MANIPNSVSLTYLTWLKCEEVQVGGFAGSSDSERLPSFVRVIASVRNPGDVRC